MTSPDSSRGAEELLRTRGVFDVDHQGWLNEDEVDPDGIGYVMWTESPPYDHDFAAWQDDVPPRRAPTPQEQRLMELGSDFFGLMKTSRHFIGLALLAQPSVPTMRVEATEFDYQEFAGLSALVAAYDRLRDFMIVVVSAQKTGRENELNDALDSLARNGIRTVPELRAAFHEGRKTRGARNEVIHGLATEPARVQRRLIDADREAHRTGSWGPHRVPSDTYDEMIRKAQEQETSAAAAVEARARLLCDTYNALITLGEASFRTEYEWRGETSGVQGGSSYLHQSPPRSG